MYTVQEISHRSLGKRVSFEESFEGGKTGNFPYGKWDAVPSL